MRRRGGTQFDTEMLSELTPEGQRKGGLERHHAAAIIPASEIEPEMGGPRGQVDLQLILVFNGALVHRSGRANHGGIDLLERATVDNEPRSVIDDGQTR